MINAQGLTKKYGDFTAVDSVSFDIAPGEIVGLLGHNGAGKTTIMRMLTGFLEPSAGSIRIAGMNITERRSDIQKKTGYLPENCPLYPEMTAIDYLEYSAELKSIPLKRISGAVRDAIRRTELGAKAGHPIHTLSRGYRQRVGVAQAILGDPELLILDEPTNGLDPSQIQHMRTLITGMGKNSTVIVSTHILQEVQAICDRVIIILDGRVALDDTMKGIQRSERLLLSIDHGPEKARGRLVEIKDVQKAEFLSAEGRQNHYALTLEPAIAQDGLAAATPGIAKAVLDLGYELYAIHPEKRGLESVFREINSTNGETRHAS